MSEISVNSILDASGGATTTINGFTPTVSNMAGRNRIINGDMRIDQRNAGAAVTVGAGATTYITDRFWSEQNTGTGTITGQQSTLGNAKSSKLTATAAITALTTNLFLRGIEQRLESQNVFDLNSKSIRVSFQVETNWTGNLSVALRNSDSTRSYVVDAAVTSGTNTVSFTVAMESNTVLVNTSAIGLVLAIGFNNEADYQTATTGSWLAGFVQTSTSSTQWAKTTGNFINVTEVQLEEGSVATPFEHRQYGQELALCERYFEVLAPLAIMFPWSSGAQIIRFSQSYRVTKRATPTIVMGTKIGGTGTIGVANVYTTGTMWAGSGSQNDVVAYENTTASSEL